MTDYENNNEMYKKMPKKEEDGIKGVLEYETNLTGRTLFASSSLLCRNV